MFNRSLLSSQSSEWQTPLDLFRALDNEFGFRTDPCTTPDNPLGTEVFYTKEQDGLDKGWIEPVFINPPYGQEIVQWIRQASFRASQGCSPIVMLLPARTDTRWFHNYIYGKAEIRFLKGRLKFGEADNSAPFPSMIVIFKKGGRKK